VTLNHPHRPLLALGLIAALLLSGCGGGPAAQRPSTATAAPTSGGGTASAIPTTGASPTPVAASAGDPAVNGERVYADVRKFAVEIGPRVAGTPSEIAARDYIKSTLESDGYDVTLQDFGFDASAFLPVRVDAAETAIPGFAFKGSPAGSARGRVVTAGIGRPEEFPAGGLGGSIALIERGELTFKEKAANAIAAGAGGVIVYNNAPGRLSADLEQDIAIPVVGIEQAAGEDLARRTQAGPLDATITVSPPRGTAWNVIAKPKGVSTCTTITGGHYDSVAVTGGADDNASGAAAVLEVARVVAAKRLHTAHCFALFSAEEFGLVGSREFVSRLSSDELSQLRVMVNLDVVGVAEKLELIGDADLQDVGRIEAQKLGIETIPGTIPQGSGSDHLSFQRANVPVLMLYRSDESIHTPVDAIGRIEGKSLVETVRVALATLAALEPE
jgi:aminopeptidase YwaD